MFRIISKLVFKIFGWKIEGWPPDFNKYIITVAPHTSNWDFIMGVFTRSITRMRAKYLAKNSLFIPPVGWVFKALGGYPVDRSKSGKMVDKVVKIINSHEHFILAIAPEGTRQKVKEWKSGFYYIAHGAKVPIVMASINYRLKKVFFSKPFYTTGNYEQDMVLIKEFYNQVK